MAIAMLATNNSRRLGDLALLLGFVGALLVAWAAGSFLAGSQSDWARRHERLFTLVGGLLIAGAFLVLFVVRVFLH